MISKILREFEKREQEKRLNKKLEKVWFKKINDDNVRPIYQPFKFYESIEINNHYQAKQKLNKNNDEYEKQMSTMKTTKIIFGKQYRKNHVEQMIDNNLFCYDMVLSNPTELQNCYIRDKSLNEIEDNNFFFQKFEKEFRFGELLKDYFEKEENSLLNELKNFIIEVKNDNLINYLRDYSDYKYEDDDKVLTDKKIEDWKKTYNKIDELKTLSGEVKMIKFAKNEEYIMNLFMEIEKKNDEPVDGKEFNQTFHDPTIVRSRSSGLNDKKSKLLKFIKLEDFSTLEDNLLRKLFKNSVSPGAR